MLNRFFLLGVLLVASGTGLAKPRNELAEALRLAEAYVSERKIPNADRYLTSVSWHEVPGHPEKSCWSILWAPNELKFDAQLVVWVCGNGSIRHQAGGWA